jgi:hypothetical protein
MSGYLYSEEDITRGLALTGAPLSTTQATGLGGLAPSSADWAAFREQTLARTGASAGAAGLRAPSAQQAPAYYNPTTNQMFAGDQTFDIRDVNTALQVNQRGLTPGAAPQGAGWEPISQQDFSGYLAGLAERRGTGELLARGARAAVGNLVTGVGRGAEMLGATNVGPTIAGFGEAITGQDEFDRQRSALIARNSSTGARIFDAAIESLPIVLPTVLGGGAGALAAGTGARALGLGATASRLTATGGSIGGATTVSFPYHLASIYEQAQRARTPDGQKAYDETSPEVQREIFYGAAFNSFLDALAPGVAAARLSSAMRRGAREATDQALAGWARTRAVAGSTVGSAVSESLTEATQTLVERALFDPEFRRQLNASDWQSLAPYIVSKYGEDMLIAAGAGALLGAGFGAAGRFAETRPRDVLQGTGTQQEQAQAQAQAQVPGTPAAVAAAAAAAPAGEAPPAAPAAGIVPPGAAPITPGAAAFTGEAPITAPTPAPTFSPAAMGGFGFEAPTAATEITPTTVPPPPRQSASPFGPPRPPTQPYMLGPVIGPEFGPPGTALLPSGEFGPPAPERRLSAEPFGPFAGPRFGPPTPTPPSMPAPETVARAPVETAPTLLPPNALRQRAELAARARANAGKPTPDVLFDPASAAETQRLMESYGLRAEDVLTYRDPVRALDGMPITARDVNEAAAILGRRNIVGTQPSRPAPQVSAPIARVMQDAGLTIEDVMAARNRLKGGPVTYEDVRTAARRKGVELPLRMETRAAPAPATVAAAEPTPAPSIAPGPAMWAGPDADIPVTVMPEPPQLGPDGRYYQRVSYEGRDSYVPADQLSAAPAPTKPTPKRGAKTSAAEKGKVGQSRLRKRAPVDEGGAAPKAGGGDSTLRRGTRAETKAEEVDAGATGFVDSSGDAIRVGDTVRTTSKTSENKNDWTVQAIRPTPTGTRLILRSGVKTTNITQEDINSTRNRLLVVRDGVTKDTAPAPKVTFKGRSTTEETPPRPLERAAPVAAATPSVEAPTSAATPPTGQPQFVLPDGSRSDVVFFHPSAQGVAAAVGGAPRAMVVRNINGVVVPFYLSTGEGGKARVPAGRWYPFFGMTKGFSWLNKGTQEQIVDYYGVPELRDAAQQLDAQYGDIRNRPDAAPTLYADNNVFDVINQDMTPVNYGDPKSMENIARTLKRIVGDERWPGVRQRLIDNLQESVPTTQQPAPVTAETPSAPSITPSVEAPTADTRLNEQITKAASTGVKAVQNLRELRSDLITRREAASGAGRSTTELTQAIERIDELLATPTELGILPPNHPQSRWAQVMDDEGIGYNNLSAQGRQEWDRLVSSNVPLTPEVARNVQATFPTEDTRAGVAFVQRLKATLDKGVDDFDRLMKITDQLQRLSESDNPVVAEAARVALEPRGIGQFSLADWNTLTGARNITGSRVSPVAPGRARMIVQNFRSKLATKPNITVVANQSELRRTNPALYARAEAARPQGDFATANAAGYSFADGEVIIFTDRIANEQHLRFVLAHETVGHFGMRGIMPGDKFNALMESIYDQDPQARAAANDAMTARGMSKSEAVEEYLSDYAGVLATSTVMRVWNAIKNFLSKLGVRFGDSFTRYFLDQSLRYVREGRQGVTFDAEAVGRRLHAVETGNIGTGRYSPEAAMSASSRARIHMDSIAANYKDLDGLFSAMSSVGKNFAGQFDRFKAKFWTLTDFRAMDNPWLFRLNGLFDLMSSTAMSVRNNINEFLRPVFNLNKASQEKISQVMYDVREAKDAQFNTSKLPKGKLFSVNSNGDVVLNPDVEGPLFKDGLLTLEQIRKGMKYKFTIEGTDGKPQTIDREIPARPDFTDAEYAAYVRARRAMANVELQLLEAMYKSMLKNRSVTDREVSRLIKGSKRILDPKDKAFVRAYADKYQEFYMKDSEASADGTFRINSDSMANSQKFLRAVNEAFIWRDTANLDPAREKAVRDFFSDKTEADDFMAKLTDTRSRRDKISDSNRLDLQTAVEQLVMMELDYSRKEQKIKENIATGYIPVYREGMFQVTLRAHMNGKPVTVKNTHKDLLAYSQFDTEQDALDFAKKFNDDLNEQSFELLVQDDAGNFKPGTVTLVADVGVVNSSVMVEPKFDLDNFLYGMQILGQKLDPKVMERLIIRTANHNSTLRRRLKFSQTPGYDNKLGITAISRHIEKQASAIARTVTRPDVRELMDLSNPESYALLHGNKENVARLRAEYERVFADPNSTKDMRADIRSRYTRAAAMNLKTNPPGKASLANQFYNEGSRAIEFLDGNKAVDEADFGSGPVLSRLRSYTGMVQLGGTIAQGILNILSVETNWKPYMASFNQRTGFGAGFNYFSATAEYNRAFMKIGGPGMLSNTAMNRADFYDSGPRPSDKTLAATWKPGIAQDPALQKKYGMTAEEARVMAREIREGKLIPAQSNSMTATARGYSTNKWALKFMDVWMAPFNLSEQAARRSAFLAAYRMFYRRGIGSGMDAKKASEMAREEAIRSLDLTLGNYSVMNRPSFWRGGVQSFAFMYKTYPLTVVQLLNNLSRPAQLSMLFGIWMLSGLSGLPFAEDLEDALDTIAQRLGFSQGSIRAELTRHIEESFPGWSARTMRGLINELGLFDVASRTSLGNIVPGTDIALAGADQMRSVMDILGPTAGFLKGAFVMANNIVTYPFSPTKTLEDIARESPVTLFRLLGDTSAYVSSGAVVDRRGYVVSPDMDAGTILGRVMGFYPQAAAAQYDVIRMATRETDYQKQMVGAFRQAWLRATLRGDTEGAQEVMDAVRSWHESTRGTALDIPPGRFAVGNTRALREANMSASERTLRASPLAAQDSVRRLMDAMTE